MIDRSDGSKFIWVEETPRVDGLSISPTYEWDADERKVYTIVLRPEVVLRLARDMEEGRGFSISRVVILQEDTVVVNFSGRREGDVYVLSIHPRGMDAYEVRVNYADACLYGEFLRNYAYDLFNRSVAARKLRLQQQQAKEER